MHNNYPPLPYSKPVSLIPIQVLCILLLRCNVKLLEGTEAIQARPKNSHVMQVLGVERSASQVRYIILPYKLSKLINRRQLILPFKFLKW